MSIARTHRLIQATKPEPAVVTLAGHLDRMVAIQMQAYPADWSEQDRREMAERSVFGTTAHAVKGGI